jgi:hypothetical protein
VTEVSVAPGIEKAGHDTAVGPPTPPAKIAGKFGVADGTMQSAEGVVFAYATPSESAPESSKVSRFKVENPHIDLITL